MKMMMIIIIIIIIIVVVFVVSVVSFLINNKQVYMLTLLSLDEMLLLTVNQELMGHTVKSHPKAT